MLVEDLSKYGLHDIIILKLKELGYDSLTEVQLRAVQEGLFDRINLLVNAPTNTGKTFIGELAVLHNSKQIEKQGSFFLVPMKALADQIYRDFQYRYSEWGLKSTISTADHYETDDTLEQYDVVVCTYEKLDSLIVKNPRLLQGIGLVVIDEIQHISERSRGIGLEFLITKLMLYCEHPQLIGLSATATNADQLASWLNAKLIQVDRRDVELREGILYTGTNEIEYEGFTLSNGDFLYKEFNTKTIGVERGLHLNKIKQISEKCVSEPCIIFLSTTRRTHEIADDLIKLFPEKHELIELQTELDNYVEYSPISRKLREVMKHSVAFHHAGLLYEERRIVEKAFREGKIRIIAATTTLGAGINTPAKNVIILFNKYHDGTPLLVRNYKNISGRAGRLRVEEDFGRSLLFASNLKEFDSLWRNYINARPEVINSQIPRKNGLPCSLLGLISSGVSQTRDELRYFIMCSFFGNLIKNDTKESQDVLMKELIDDQISYLVDNGFLIEEDEKLEITELGIRCAEEQLSPQTILLLYQRLNENIATINATEDYNQLITSIIHLICSTRDSDLLYPPRSKTEIEELNALWKVYEESFFYTPTNRDLFLQSLRTTRMLQRWIEGASYYNLASYAPAGHIKRIAENIHWILRGCARLVQRPVLPIENKFSLFLFELSERILYGVPKEALPILRLGIDGIQRRRAINLFAQGFSDLDDFLSASIEELTSVDEIKEPLATRIKSSIEDYIIKDIDRTRTIQSREIKELGYDIDLIEKLYELHGDDYTRHIVHLLKDIIKIDAEFIGEIAPHEPDVIIRTSKGNIIFEGKRKEGGKVNTKEAEEILGKGAKYNPIILGTFGHPDFVNVAQKNSLHTKLTLIPTRVIGEILIKFLKDEIDSLYIIDVLSVQRYIANLTEFNLELS